jgi:thioredoxin
MVLQISSSSEFSNAIRGPGLVVVDFFATWCGPCQQIAPYIEQLSHKYPMVKFLKVDVDACQEVAMERRVSSMPTFQFFVKGQMVYEMKGANPSALEAAVVRFKVEIDPFAGQGFKLTQNDQPPVELSAKTLREARLAALQQNSKTSTTVAHASTLKDAAKEYKMDVDGDEGAKSIPSSDKTSNEVDDDELAMAIALSMNDAKADNDLSKVVDSTTNLKSSTNADLSAEDADAQALAEMEIEQKLEVRLVWSWTSNEMPPYDSNYYFKRMMHGEKK